MCVHGHVCVCISATDAGGLIPTLVSTAEARITTRINTVDTTCAGTSSLTAERDAQKWRGMRRDTTPHISLPERQWALSRSMTLPSHCSCKILLL